MFVLSTQDNAMFRGIATVVTIALVLYTVGTVYVRTAQAVSVTNAYDLLETSATSTVSNHTIQFVTPTGMVAGGTATITFPVGFDLTSVTEDEVDLDINGTDEDTAAAAVGAVWGVTVSGQDLVIESGTDTVGANATITIEIGDNATAFGAGSALNKIVNPSAQGSYVIDIDVNGVDTGATQVAIVDSVYITASVDTSFDFLVTGFATAGTAVNGTSTTATTTSTSIPFGSLVAGEIVTSAQNLRVTTNAINGYAVTVEVDNQLESSTGADIDGFADGAYDDTPAVWTAPGGGSPDIAIEDEWGHWGITTTDDDIQGNGVDFSANNTWISASTTPRTIMAHDGPSDGSTGSDTIAGGDDIGSTTIGFQIEISALQEAADDYQAILTYIATPTF